MEFSELQYTAQLPKQIKKTANTHYHVSFKLRATLGIFVLFFN